LGAKINLGRLWGRSFARGQGQAGQNMGMQSNPLIACLMKGGLGLDAVAVAL
jgi:hypothetical protein